MTAAATPRAGESAELLLERRAEIEGFEIELFVTRGVDGTLLSEATLRDPTKVDELEVWTDGVTVWWVGTVDGEAVERSAPVIEIVDPSEPPAAICLHPVGAIVCIGAAVVLLGGCGFGFACSGDDPRSGPSNPPDSSGHGEPSGGGDAEGDGGDESDGGGDGE